MDKRVGFGLRFAAALIDLGIVAVVGFIAGAAVGGMLGGGIGGVLGGAAGGDGPAAGAGLGAAAGAVIGAVGAMSVFGGFVFLYSLIEAFTGASPGKMSLGLRVGNADGRRGAASLYVKRWAIKYSGTLLGLLGAIPALHMLGLVAPAASLIVFIGCFLALGDRRQTLHDLGAATAVFRKADLLS